MTLTVAQAVKKYGPQGRTWLQERCRGAKLAYPPKSLTLIGLKEERLLLVYGDDGNGGSKELAAFPLVSYSGKLGPKLREGDLQIPEGIHKITRMKTNGLLSFELDYPNAVDRRNAAADGRRNLGGDILVHGGSYSTGCLVISNEDMKPLFVAVNDVGIRNTRVIIAPCDLTRRMPNVDMQKQPAWLPTVYASIKHELQKTMIPRAQNRLR
jgi:murein L,D-transpeptidase YafK